MTNPTYTNYRDSEAQWLGDIPEHWLTSPVWGVASCNDEVLAEATPDDTEITYVEISGVTAGAGITDVSEMTFADAPSRARRKVESGDILVSTVRTYLRAIAPAIDPPANLVASTGFAVLRPRKVNSGYLGYAVQAEFFISHVIARSVGVSYPAINASDLVRITLPIPPLHEQTAIATFLDCETGKIDALVEEQEWLIELLKEKRQAVISHAVTKGLNPGARMKDTGIERLREVPADWEVGRLKHYAEVRGRIGFRGYTSDDLVAEGEGALTLGGANLSERGAISLDARTYLTWAKYEESPEIKVSPGDILIGQRGTCGRVAIVDQDVGAATINPSLVVLKNVSLVPQFLVFWLMGDLIQKTFGSYLNKTAVPMLSQEQIGGVPALAPPLAEQFKIASYLSKATAEIDCLVADCEMARSLLLERRAALISAAVAGKIDVRNLVATQEAAE